jgi:diguanylate cyclase (GGDEF)-like protein
MDFVPRYGGEEFAVIAPECNPSNLAPLAERLRLAVADIRLPFQGRDLRVTTSVGAAFAQWPDHPKSAAEFIGIADQLLYEAKRSGRNCCRAEEALAQVS